MRVHAGNVHVLGRRCFLSGCRCAVASLLMILFSGVVTAFSYPQEAQLYLTMTSGTFGEGKPVCHSSFFSVIVIAIVVIAVRCR